MSIAELNGPTPHEVSVLMIARASGGRADIDGCAHEAETRVAARRLVERRFGEMFADERGEFFRTNSAGARWLSSHLTQQVGR